MSGQQVGSTIGAVFGLVYVLVNSGPLPGPVSLGLRILGGLGFGIVMVEILRGEDRSERTGQRIAGRAYWLVVAAEAVALFGGLAIINGPLHASRAAVAWVSLVVGVHFFALAYAFGESLFHRLGAAITLCGAAGLVLAAAGVGAAPIAAVSGVVPGWLLLASGWWGARQANSSLRGRPVSS